MEIALRVALAPMVVLLASLVQRRVGPLWGGRLIGFPLTTGPFLAVLCLSYDTATAARAAAGVIAGQLVVVCFCLGYGHLAARFGPLWSLAGALGVGAAAGAALSPVRPVWLATAIVLAVVAGGLATWPHVRPAGGEREARPGDGEGHPVWQTVLRMVVTGALVASLAWAAGIVGAHLAGILSSAPVILSVLVPATHRRTGPGDAADIVRGALVSIPAAVLFITVLAYTVDGGYPLAAFGLAGLVLLAASLLPWARLSRPRPADPPNRP